MSDIAKREFNVLAVVGSNYLTWDTDVKIKLEGMSLDHTGKDEHIKLDKERALQFL
jgi:hypothetical protein